MKELMGAASCLPRAANECRIQHNAPVYSVGPRLLCTECGVILFPGRHLGFSKGFVNVTRPGIVEAKYCRELVPCIEGEKNVIRHRLRSLVVGPLWTTTVWPYGLATQRGLGGRKHQIQVNWEKRCNPSDRASNGAIR